MGLGAPCRDDGRCADPGSAHAAAVRRVSPTEQTGLSVGVRACSRRTCLQPYRNTARVVAAALVSTKHPPRKSLLTLGQKKKNAERPSSGVAVASGQLRLAGDVLQSKGGTTPLDAQAANATVVDSPVQAAWFLSQGFAHRAGAGPRLPLWSFCLALLRCGPISPFDVPPYPPAPVPTPPFHSNLPGIRRWDVPPTSSPVDTFPKPPYLVSWWRWIGTASPLPTRPACAASPLPPTSCNRLPPRPPSPPPRAGSVPRRFSIPLRHAPAGRRYFFPLTCSRHADAGGGRETGRRGPASPRRSAAVRLAAALRPHPRPGDASTPPSQKKLGGGGALPPRRLQGRHWHRPAGVAHPPPRAGVARRAPTAVLAEGRAAARRRRHEIFQRRPRCPPQAERVGRALDSRHAPPPAEPHGQRATRGQRGGQRGGAQQEPARRGAGRIKAGPLARTMADSPGLWRGGIL